MIDVGATHLIETIGNTKTRESIEVNIRWNKEVSKENDKERKG